MYTYKIIDILKYVFRTFLVLMFSPIIFLIGFITTFTPEKIGVKEAFKLAWRSI